MRSGGSLWLFFAALVAPDGRRLITMQGDGGSFSNLYLIDGHSGASIRLGQQDKMDGSPRWSPDGTRLAFSSIRDGNVEAYIMDDDGSGVQRLTDDPAEDRVTADETSPAWR